jgi:hypothetical protein
MLDIRVYLLSRAVVNSRNHPSGHKFIKAKQLKRWAKVPAAGLAVLELHQVRPSFQYGQKPRELVYTTAP